MRKYISIATGIAALFLAFGCAKEKTTVTNEGAKRYFEKWREVQEKYEHPEYLFRKEGAGSYTLTETEGSGERVDDYQYLFVKYTSTDLDGNVISTTDSTLINYTPSDYYGPIVWINSDEARTVGVRDIISGMKVGGTRKAVVPAWMHTTTRYATEEEYLANVTSGSNTIYNITVEGVTKDILKWQIDSLEKYNVKQMEDVDSTYYGFYFMRLAPLPETEEGSKDKTQFPDDTTIYINYTGRLLNGQVFDTTIEDTAKVHKIYSASKTYEPIKVTYNADSTAVKLNGNSVVTGFASLIKRLKNLEGGDSAMATFYSSLGYGGSSNGSKIPAYSSLHFEVGVVPKEEEEE